MSAAVAAPIPVIAGPDRRAAGTGPGAGRDHRARPADELSLAAAVEVAAYRIVLEAMTNIARHARPRRAGGDQRRRRAATGDHRRRRRQPEAFGAGLGIASMRERATELGGHCMVTPATPRGTTVRATIPLEIR